MASHTIVVNGTPTTGEYYRRYNYDDGNTSDVHQDCSFTFSLPDLTGCTITRVAFSATVASTQSQGSYGNFTMKLAGSQIGQWLDKTFGTKTVSNLSLVGSAGKMAEFTCAQATSTHMEGSWPYYHGYTGAVLKNPKLTITFDGELSETTVFPISSDTISSSKDTEFSWNLNSFAEVTSQSLFWKQSTDADYTEIELETDQTTYTFEGGTFSNGTILWYVSATDVDNNTATSEPETVTVGIVPSVTISYPLGVNIKSSNIQVFTWEMSEDIETGQYSYEIQYKEAEDESWTTVSATSENEYHSFAANTFPAGEYSWKLKITNNDGISTSYVSSSFTAIGSTNAPVISSVTNSSIPTITWTVTSQDTFEVEIYKGSERIYSSGVQVGHDVRSFTPNIMLEDGNYIIKMRAMNDYGYFTPWLDYSFVLNPDHPDALTCYAYANERHGITVARSLELDPVTPSSPAEEEGVPSAYYVIRRIQGEAEWKILGKLSTTDESVKYEDNTVLPGVTYEYAIRNYESEEGYTDSNIVPIQIDFLGVIVSSGSKYVHMFLTEDVQFEITHASVKEQTYSHMIGRKYPVKESSEWVAQSNSFSCFVEFDQYQKLRSFYEGNEDLWFRGKNFSYQCSIDTLAIKETLFGEGYELSIDISRTDEEELRLF